VDGSRDCEGVPTLFRLLGTRAMGLSGVVEPRASNLYVFLWAIGVL
jgi:hypothetical protein